LEGIMVEVYQDGPVSLWDITDENGYYSISVIEGEWEAELNEDDLIPDYLVPNGAGIYVAEGAVEVLDFMVYTTDSSITGAVYLDDVLAYGFEIYAFNYSLGYSYDESAVDGFYSVPVSSLANSMDGYELSIGIWDIPGLYVDEYYSEVMAGSSGIDFHIHTATGGIEGTVYDSGSMEPAEGCWVTATDGVNYYGSGTDDDGSYILYLPNGNYEVWAQGEWYYQEVLENIVVNDNYVNIDFYLDPITVDGALQGFVYEEGSENPVSNVEISVYNYIFWIDTATDELGYYHLDLPNGFYTLECWISLILQY